MCTTTWLQCSVQPQSCKWLLKVSTRDITWGGFYNTSFIRCSQWYVCSVVWVCLKWKNMRVARRYYRPYRVWLILNFKPEILCLSGFVWQELCVLVRGNTCSDVAIASIYDNVSLDDVLTWSSSFLIGALIANMRRNASSTRGAACWAIVYGRCSLRIWAPKTLDTSRAPKY